MMRAKMILMAAVGMAVLAGAPVVGPAAAKDQPTVEARVDKLEHEMRAVQRKVFPGADGKYFQPEITAPDQPVQQAPGTPALGQVADLEGRVSALESQTSALTGQVETTSHRLQVLEEAFNAYKRTTDARLKALEDGATNVQAPDGTAFPPTKSTPVGTPIPTPRPTTTGGVPKPTTGVVKADPARAAAVAAIQKPVTSDAADDFYVYGYRLWNAKLYPEAEDQLKTVVDKYPQHRRASWAQNLLGRAYLDEGRNKEAAQAFYDNYKKNPEGERTPDSVYYLATALKKLNRPTPDVCKAYSVLLEAYGPKLTSQMSADVAKQRADLKCA
ncbi:MAG: tetratricopeptide repeat protein [Sphingomonas sp.]|jgi:TolA-binding protein